MQLGTQMVIMKPAPRPLAPPHRNWRAQDLPYAPGPGQECWERAADRGVPGWLAASVCGGFGKFAGQPAPRQWACCNTPFPRNDPDNRHFVAPPFY